MEWFTKLFDIGKLPSKILAWVSLLSGVLLFGSPKLLTKLHLDAIPTNYGFYIGVAFVGSASLLAINFVLWLSHSIRRFFIRRRWKVRLVDSLLQLDPSEKAILREFYILNQDSLRMPIDNPTVAGLRNKGILRAVGQLGEHSIAGILFPLTIEPEVKRVLSFQLIDLPLGEPTEQERQWIIQSRPSYVRQLDRLDWLRNGL